MVCCTTSILDAENWSIFIPAIDLDIVAMSKCGRPSVGTSVIQGDILTLSHSHTDQDPEHNPVHHDMDYYERFTRGRKIIIVVLISFYGFLSPFSSISVLAATPELAAAFGTTGSIINVSNALYMVFMALSAPVWAPLSQVYGRKLVCTLDSPSASQMLIVSGGSYRWSTLLCLLLS